MACSVLYYIINLQGEMSMNIKINEVQLAFFFLRTNNTLNNHALNNGLFNIFKDRFQNLPEFLSVPAPLYNDLPVFRWQSEDMFIAYDTKRFDLRFHPMQKVSVFDQIIEYTKLIEGVFKDSGICIGNIGLVIYSDDSIPSIASRLNMDVFIGGTPSEYNISWRESDNGYNIWYNIGLKDATRRTSIDINNLSFGSGNDVSARVMDIIGDYIKIAERRINAE